MVYGVKTRSIQIWGGDSRPSPQEVLERSLQAEVARARENRGMARAWDVCCALEQNDRKCVVLQKLMKETVKHTVGHSLQHTEIK
jgi:invasion protein IalB